MHFRTHVKKEHRGISGQDEYGDGMVEHDMHVGELLDLLDELEIAHNTIVRAGPSLVSEKDQTPSSGSSVGEERSGTSEPQRVVSLDAYRGFIMVTLTAAGFGLWRTAENLAYWPGGDSDGFYSHEGFSQANLRISV